MVERSIVVGGRRLWFWRSERTPAAPLLVLHGLGADHEGLAPLAARLAGFDPIAVDLPGHGRSEPLAVRHTPDAYASVIEALCAELDLRDVTVLGHSLGATIALTHAARFPDRVRALALLMPVTTGTGPSTWPARTYYRIGSVLPPPVARPWFLSRPAVFVSDELALVSRDREVRRAVRQQDYRTAMMVSPRVVPEIYRGIRRTPLLALAGQVRADTLIVGAERDSLAPRRSLLELRRRVPGSDLVVVPGAGHLWPVEAPEAAAALIARRLAQLRR